MCGARVLPSSFKIAGLLWKVVLDDHIASEMARYGECRMVQQQLAIAKGLKPDQEMQTFLHEVIHAVNGIVDLELTEHQIAGLTPLLYDALRNCRIWDAPAGG